MDELTPRQLIDLLAQYKEQNESLASCVRVLCYLMKDFSFDMAELNSDEFKARIDELVASLDAADSPKTVRRAFEKGKDSILAFIAREKTYLNDRESEFKNIIEFLRKTLANVVGENRTFNSELYEQNLRMEKLVHIDDIRKIKESLQLEVVKMQATIQAKQANDAKRIDVLSKEIEILRTSLQGYKDAATIDSLTRAANRLAFDNEIKTALEQAEVHRKPVSLLMCDVDDFKGFNTKHGHQMGDLVLQVFVAKSRTILRDTDMIARYGGDEFAVILPGTNLRQALKIGRRICDVVSEAKYVHETPAGKTEFTFTSSVGVAEFHKTDKVKSLIGRADKAMYAAKYAGKGCVRTEKDLTEDVQRKAA